MAAASLAEACREELPTRLTGLEPKIWICGVALATASFRIRGSRSRRESGGARRGAIFRISDSRRTGLLELPFWRRSVWRSSAQRPWSGSDGSWRQRRHRLTPTGRTANQRARLAANARDGRRRPSVRLAS